ncbi:DNA damage response protein kinase [Komagataella phaffii CBS 7435]|uniref:Cell-cycle checkpoint serine-threonine kinase n=2 Tax=Komagataella phaffii TaxID=460519 RepID=C4R321_KOMPG|nr:Cell-cycle checkpoint serine-threonine kinase [Komagataella phaffii GS115]AOA61918.1 GQ67_01314T0 [Komagataella phaffii]CAH2447544.1 DNA damage response protein kinase [Komagataella phaffii CBS 7435]AOA67549.1 GQ68_00076T0 [Komagataella phaffii GS115]CAY69895.1 Cell-cycle checkpoint serine-threonine kinase [Komagataella phaffii GS115]CCA37737.2 DNA damage response protein kinase [Komagataella phaffii CBS 7435]
MLNGASLKRKRSLTENFNISAHGKRKPQSAQIIAKLASLKPDTPHIDVPQKETVLIGRSSSCDITLNFPDVSTKHCVLELKTIRSGETSRFYFVLHDNSSNGTYVNGERVSKEKPRFLKSGDNVAFAASCSYVLKYIDDEEFNSPGSFFDKYLVGKLLGSGHYAQVKEAQNKTTGEICAVKIFHPRKSSDNDETNKQMNQEMNLLMSINHPNIVKFYHTFIEPMNEHSVTTYLVLEKVNGGELFNRVVKKGKLREDESKNLFKQLLSGLNYLHSNEIVHRDIKPENILLDITPRKSHREIQTGPWDEDELNIVVKIADFGLAKFIGDMRFTNTLCGTPAYVAPEILTSNTTRRYNKQVDLWSTGVLLYVCLCGFPPFSEELSPPSMREQILRGRFAFFSPYWDTIHDDALDLISKLLIVNPSDRITMEQTLRHPWFIGTAEDAASSVPESDKYDFQEMYARAHSVRVPVRQDTNITSLRDQAQSSLAISGNMDVDNDIDQEYAS